MQCARGVGELGRAAIPARSGPVRYNRELEMRVFKFNLGRDGWRPRQAEGQCHSREGPWRAFRTRAASAAPRCTCTPHRLPKHVQQRRIHPKSSHRSERRSQVSDAAQRAPMGWSCPHGHAATCPIPHDGTRTAQTLARWPEPACALAPGHTSCSWHSRVAQCRKQTKSVYSLRYSRPCD